MSISYGQCETVNGAAANVAYNSAYQQAVAEGVSVFVAAGDSGAAGCDNSVSEATHGHRRQRLCFHSQQRCRRLAPISATLTPAPTLPTGIPAIRPPSVRPSLTFRKSPGMIPAPAQLLTAYVGYSPTYGSTSLCNDPVYGSLFQTTVGGGGGPANAQPGPRLQAASSAALAKDGRNLPGRAYSAIPTTACATLRTFRSSLPMDSGATSTFSAGRILMNGGAACGSDPSAWSGAGGTSFASPSWRASRRSSIRKPAGLKAIPPPFITS